MFLYFKTLFQSQAHQCELREREGRWVMRLRIPEKHQTRKGAEVHHIGCSWDLGPLGSGTRWGEPAPNCGSFTWPQIRASIHFFPSLAWLLCVQKDYHGEQLSQGLPTAYWVTRNEALVSSVPKINGAICTHGAGITWKQNWVWEAPSLHLSC